MQRLLPIATALLLTLTPWLTAADVTLQRYERPRALTPPPAGEATLYATPWRAQVRTASAHEALRGVGVYYKHIPEWTEAEHTRVLQQMAAAGVRRVRLAPHHAIYMHPGWSAPSEAELTRLRAELRACHTAGIRPCVVFVHIPPYGEKGELQEWFTRKWNKGLLPAGPVGSEEYEVFLQMTYRALRFILNEAREAGFTEPGSYDLELGQGMWWGAPSITDPPPSTTLEDLDPGGRVFTFESQLIDRLRADGYEEPAMWWGMTHHLFDRYDSRNIHPDAAGRAISFYSQGVAKTDAYLAGDNRVEGALDTWPPAEPMQWAHGKAPSMVLARPEGWMADFSRHDNLVRLLERSRKDVAITSLGLVPRAIPDHENLPIDGWTIKQRAVPRSLAFWLNQGAEFVLIHSAYEPRRKDAGEMHHSLIPSPIEPSQFNWRDAKPLRSIRRFRDGLAGASPIANVEPLSFRLAVEPDPVLIPAVNGHGPLKASDAVALLPYQVDADRYAVAAYVLTPNIADPMKPVTLTLEIDQAIDGEVRTLRPADGETGAAAIVSRNGGKTTIRCEIVDHVTWLRFTVD